MKEKLYKKIGKRYVEVSIVERFEFDMGDGIWIVQNKPGCKSISSLVWRVGDLKRPVDIVTYAGLLTLEDKLASYLTKLGDENSDEFKEAKELKGSWINGPIKYYNISANDLVNLFIRKISTHLEQGEIVTWESIVYKFREDSKLYEKPGFEEAVRILNMFVEWLNTNNVKFRQDNNIG